VRFLGLKADRIGVLTLALSLAFALTPQAALARRHHKAKPPAPVAEAKQAERPAGSTPDTAEAAPGPTPPEQTAAADDASEPPEVKRSTPADSAEEMAWVQQKIAEDPFLRPFRPIGRAPEVREFYNPLTRLQPTLIPQSSSYLVQDAQGHIVGSLGIHISRVASPLFGPVYDCLIQSDIGDRRQVEVWQSAVTAKPLKVVRRETKLVPGSAAPAGRSAPDNVLIKESLNASYYFDRVVVSKEGSDVTLAKRERLLPYTFDMAQLPLLMTQLDFNNPDWPFEAALFDPGTLQPLPLQVNQPQRRDVLSAEPATCSCWEVPVRLGNQNLVWYIERTTQRLIKFQLGTYTYTLQQYSARSGK
jgi:hypothetical protein